MRQIENNHPLTRSKWIWPEGNLYLYNVYAQFRHDFILGTVPEKAPFFVTADQAYKLYVNGNDICRGPARGFQEHWPFDEIDLHPYLKCGHNFIAAEVYNPGIGTFQYLHRSSAGFLCAAEWEGVQIHTRKSDWIMRRAPGNNPFVARLSPQMGFQEDFNAAKDDSSWITSEETPVWNENPKFRGFGEYGFGRLPYLTLEERGIPMLRKRTVVPDVSSFGCGTVKNGFDTAFNIDWFWKEEEFPSVAVWNGGRNYPQKKESDSLIFSAEPPGNGRFLAVTLDLGAIRTGSLTLELENTTGNEIADCHYWEFLENGIPRLDLPPGTSMLALATRLRAGKGTAKRTFFQLEGCRHITLVFRNLTQTLRVRCRWIQEEYPFTMRGEFRTSDSELNGIHAVCRHTQQICSLDAYVDTPWREQGQWWGDARIQARNTFYLDGDVRLFRRGIESIAAQTAPNGLTFALAPCSQEACVVPDFSLTWILTVYDYFMQTGDISLFRRHHDRIKAIFRYFDSTETRGTNGILRFDPKCWLFEDWAGLPKRGYPTFLNLWHFYTLQHYGKLLRYANDSDSNRIAEMCAERKQSLESFFFDPEQGLMRSGREEDGSVSSPPSVHDQVLAILTGLVPEHHREMAEKRILPFLRDETLDCAVPTSFWCNYLFSAAEQLGCRAETLNFIRKHWSRMIPCGGTWETLEWNRAEGHSCSHAWSAHPVCHIPDLLLGLRQLAPAWKEFECAPAFELLPETGRILLPLPPGDLIFEWNRDIFQITVPPGTEIHTGPEPQRFEIKKEKRV